MQAAYISDCFCISPAPPNSSTRVRLVTSHLWFGCCSATLPVQPPCEDPIACQVVILAPQLLARSSHKRPGEHSRSSLPSEGGGPGSNSVSTCHHTRVGFFFSPSAKQQLLAKSNRWRKSPLSVLERTISPVPLPLARKNQHYHKH